MKQEPERDELLNMVLIIYGCIFLFCITAILILTYKTMTSEQLMNYPKNYEQALEYVLSETTKQYMPQLKLLKNSDTGIEAALHSAMFAFYRRMNEEIKRLNNPEIKSEEEIVVETNA